ncbi:Sideroflexin-3 [Orchesella cincta]|uniref:Sidoreflexin n=1 Tax=Orchesella cincta TaxID=48709 RepID=A0A1D2MZH6_ORCCI|nr:Sideroflexin-3 [Orchesella cincta]
MNSSTTQRINLDNQKWDQNTFLGRFKYFLVTTNVLRLFHSESEFDNAKDIVTRYRRGEDIPGLSEDELWKAKHIYDSAFHPDTGEKVHWVGRMSGQLPVNTFIYGCMLNFYKTQLHVLFWQWVHRSAIAFLNYCNRSGDSPISLKTLGLSYVLGVGGSLIVTNSMHRFFERRQQAFPLLYRLGVASATYISIPTMRSPELMDGIPVVDEKGTRLGNSVVAAQHGINRVCVSRIVGATPVMVIPPIIMNYLQKDNRILIRHPKLHNPMQVLIVVGCLLFAAPLCCAIFPQKSPIDVSKLESDIQEKAAKLPHSPKILYYNKGL